MKTLNELKKEISIFTTFKGAGHYEVSVFNNFENLGSYLETDMEHISDIDEMKNDGFESELSNSKTFEEVVETTLKRLKRNIDLSDKTIEAIEILLEDCF